MFKMTLTPVLLEATDALRQIPAFLVSPDRLEQRMQLSISESEACVVEVFWDSLQTRVVVLEYGREMYSCDVDVSYGQILAALGYNDVSRMEFRYMEDCGEGVIHRSVSEPALFQITYLRE
jgi:hypothetical protein